jgi:hypothetical protein
MAIINEFIVATNVVDISTIVPLNNIPEINVCMIIWLSTNFFRNYVSKMTFKWLGKSVLLTKSSALQSNSQTQLFFVNTHTHTHINIYWDKSSYFSWASFPQRTAFVFSPAFIKANF